MNTVLDHQPSRFSTDRINADNLRRARELVASDHDQAIILLLGTLANTIAAMDVSDNHDAYTRIKSTCLAVANVAAIGEQNTRGETN